MDDIMRQLQLQRERQKQKTKDNKVDVSSTTEGKKQKTRETAPSIKQEIGDFRFDPISNRYLPKSSFNKQDRFEAQTKVKNVSIDRLRWEKRNSISDEDVRRIIFHGSALDYSRPQSDMQAQNKKTRKRHSGDESSITQQPDVEQQIPCSGRIVQLLTTSLQYANSHKRNAIVNILGPIAMARGATVVPSAVSDDMLTLDTMSRRFDSQPLPRGVQQGTRNRQSAELSPAENVHHQLPTGIQHLAAATARISTVKSSSNTLNQKWHSLLFPMSTRVGNSLNDCVCKAYLPPTASTFDIQSHSNSIPSVVTIADNKLFCRQSVFIPPGGRRAFQSDVPPDGDRVWNLPVLNHADTTIQCVKFAPSANLMGILANDSSLLYRFAFKNFDSKSASLMHVFELPLENGQVNDFCFSSNDQSKLVCFCGRESGLGLSYLDIPTGQILRFTKRKKSEALSVQYLGDQVICGHRNGSVSLHDARGNEVSTNLPQSFGSATFLHPLQDGNTVVVKGSFGSCRVFDVRKFQNTNTGTSKATVMDLSVPLSLVHTTNSTRCTGIALDPTETIVISPFAGQNNVSLALWCLKTGKFVRNIDLGTSDNSTQLPPFCELSSRTTPGFAIRDVCGSKVPLITKESDLGVWFKSGPNPLSPPNCGSIHHLSFPN